MSLAKGDNHAHDLFFIQNVRKYNPTSVDVHFDVLISYMYTDKCRTLVANCNLIDLTAGGTPVESNWEQESPDVYRFRYRPMTAGEYSVSVLWNGRHVPGTILSSFLLSQFINYLRSIRNINSMEIDQY